MCFLFLLYYDLCAWVWVCHGIHLAVRGQLSGISCPLPPITGDPRIPLRASDLHSKYFYPFSQLASALFSLFIV